MIPAIIMEQYPALQTEGPPHGWTLMMQNYLCPYVLRDVVKQHATFGFDLYIHNVNNVTPRSEFDEIWVKIYFKKKQVLPD